MKTSKALLGLTIIAVGFTSCKSDEEKKAEITINTYSTYVDSVGNVAAADAKANWESIDAEYMQRTTDAEAALENMKDRTAAEEKLNASKARYEELKAKYQAELDAERAAAIPTDTRAPFRDSFFGAGKLGKDLNMEWINKDNILTAYNDFNNAYASNKDKYTREDFDEIKAIYEALDARKNTVEKEGLSSADNRKIAELKLKFGPTFKIDRMKAKGDENQDAKDQAN